MPEMKIVINSDVVIADRKPLKVELKKDKNVAKPILNEVRSG